MMQLQLMNRLLCFSAPIASAWWRGSSNSSLTPIGGIPSLGTNAAKSRDFIKQEAIIFSQIYHFRFGSISVYWSAFGKIKFQIAAQDHSSVTARRNDDDDDDDYMRMFISVLNFAKTMEIKSQK